MYVWNFGFLQIKYVWLHQKFSEKCLFIYICNISGSKVRQSLFLLYHKYFIALKLTKQFDFQIANLAKFALAMTWFIENMKNIEDHSFPIIYYALKSVCGCKQAGKVRSRIYRYLLFCILGQLTGFLSRSVPEWHIVLLYDWICGILMGLKATLSNRMRFLTSQLRLLLSF